MSPLVTSAPDPSITDDLQLCQRVREALKCAGHRALGRVQVWSSQGNVSLRGEVPTGHLKQVAYAACRAVAGVKSVSNDLIVWGQDRP